MALGQTAEAMPMLAGLLLAGEDRAGDLPQALRREVDLLTRADALYEAGDPEPALELAEELLDLVREGGDPGKEASVLHLQGNILYDLERYEEALRRGQQALDLRRRHRLPGEAASLRLPSADLATGSHDLRLRKQTVLATSNRYSPTISTEYRAGRARWNLLNR